MNIAAVEPEPELQRVLWACYDYWRTEPLPPEQRVICFNWVIDRYHDRFGMDFHQSKLYWLTKFGFLKQDHTARAGNRRYYKLVDIERTADLLKQWNLSSG